MSQLHSTALLLILLAACVPTTSAAQAVAPDAPRDDEARVLFEAGRIAFNEERYDDAYRRFAEAYRLSQRPELLFNLGSAADRLGRTDIALEHYRAFVVAAPGNERGEEAAERIAALERDHPSESGTAMIPASTSGGAGPATGAGPTTEDGGSVLGEWWLWTIVGVVVVGAGVGVGVGVATSEPSVAAPILGDVGPGNVIMTLTATF